MRILMYLFSIWMLMPQIIYAKNLQSGSGAAVSTSISPTKDTQWWLRQQERGRQWGPAAAADLGQDKALAPQDFDIYSYKLQGRFDWEHKKLQAKVQVTFDVLADHLSTLTLESDVQKIAGVFDENQRPLAFRVDAAAKKLLITLPALAAGTRQSVWIHYVAAASSQLHAVGVRAGDPIQAPVVYVTSEPEGAPRWMPCHNIPSDRALFAAEFSMSSGERLVANGKLLKDKISSSGEKRTMAYATSYPLPTYLMAFAVGDFVVSETVGPRGVPISLWSRRGVQVDTQGVLAMLHQQISAYNRLMVPYPYEKYALVMLPAFPAGGIEHASITFQAETSSTQSTLHRDLSLGAHELAHQWWGDYVTVESWDDLWIKEGMATLLSQEGMRAQHEDRLKTQRLFGSTFGVDAGDAIRDPKLAPGDKYTSGPYGRSAWFLTQLRSLVGEQNFWRTISGLLQAHAWGTISTQEFLDGFHLSAQQQERAKRVLAAHALPQLQMSWNNGSTTQLQINLVDTEGALFVPLEVQILHADGTEENYLLGGGQDLHSLTVDIAHHPTILVDPREIHLELSQFFPEEKTLQQWVPLLFPLGAQSQWQHLLGQEGREALKQIFLTYHPQLPLSLPLFRQILPHLTSTQTEFLLYQKACAAWGQNLVSQNLEDRQAWQSIFSLFVHHPPYSGIPRAGSPMGFTPCPELLPQSLLQTYLDELQDSPVTAREDFLTFLSEFPSSPQRALATWGHLALNAQNLRPRTIGLEHLNKHITPRRFSYPEGDIMQQFRRFYRQQLQANEATETLRVVLTGLRLLKEQDSAPTMLGMLGNKKYKQVHEDIFCSLYWLAPTASQWQQWAQQIFREPTVDRNIRLLVKKDVQKYCREYSVL